MAVKAAPPAAKAVFSVASNSERLLPIYCVETEKPQVAISFDAAWGADDTDTLLQILEENDVKTTFFMCGYWVDKYPEEVKKIAEAGHDLGNPFRYASSYEPAFQRADKRRAYNYRKQNRRTYRR